MSEILSPKKRRAILLLLEGRRIGEICRELKIQQRTLWAWRHEDEAFMEALRSGQAEVLAESRGALKSATASAVKALREVAESHVASESARVAASAKILEITFKHLELETVEERLVEIEAALARHRAQDGAAEGRSIHAGAPNPTCQFCQCPSGVL